MNTSKRLIRYAPDGDLGWDDIYDWMIDLRSHAHVPASSFAVTTVFKAQVAGQGAWYFGGVNVEVADHRLSTHGEEGSIAAAVTALGRHVELVEGWVMGAPQAFQRGEAHELADLHVACCGKCRQQISGFGGADMPIHAVSLNGGKESTTLGEQLPNIFSFRQFAPELLEAGPQDAVVPDPGQAADRLFRQGPLTETEIIDWMQLLEAADFASRHGQHAVLRLQDDLYVAGTSIEEAAFVSINPIQAALPIACILSQATPQVQEVWTTRIDREGNVSASGLTLSALQSLIEFAGQGIETPIHLCADTSVQTPPTLGKAAAYAPTLEAGNQSSGRTTTSPV
ncbi:MAG: hypothetical protein Alpg2KO_18640 [Alphaproteobacteria bacterium]